MKVEFRKLFQQDLRNIKDRKLRSRIQLLIQEIESVNRLTEVRNIKAIQGYEGFYRLRVGDYRIGIYVVENVVAFVRVLHRKEIYRYFP